MNGRLGALTALRFPAAMLVVLHHLEGHFGVPDNSVPLRRVCVSFFFVLSGFLLYVIYSRRDPVESTSQFYRKRITRIYPLHLAVLLLTVVVSFGREWPILTDAPATWIAKLSSNALLLQCWFPQQQWVQRLNGVTWSLSVILFCYLVFPFLLRWKRFLWLILLGNVVICMSGLWAMYWWPECILFRPFAPVDVAHYFPPFRLVEFLTGMIAAQLYLRGLPKWLTERQSLATVLDIAIILVCIFVWPQVERSVAGTINPGIHNGEIAATQLLEERDAAGNAAENLTSSSAIRKLNDAAFRVSLVRWFRYTGFALPAALLVVWFASSNGLLARSLGSSIPLYLGSMSFAIFLCHRPIIIRFEEYIEPYFFSPATAVACCLALIFLTAAALYHLVEVPSLRILRRGRSRRKAIVGWTRFKPVQSKSATASGLARANLPYEICGGLLILAFAGGCCFLASRWKPLETIQFENGLQTQVSHLDKKDDRLLFTVNWRRKKPLRGKLLAVRIGQDNQIIAKTEIAVFSRERSEFRGRRMFSLRLVSRDEVDEVDHVRFEFLRVDGQQSKIQNHVSAGNPYSHVVWSKERVLDSSREFDNGLIVKIDQIERRSSEILIALTWHSRKKLEGTLFLRQVDANGRLIRRRNIRTFRFHEAVSDLSGQSQISVKLDQDPTTEAILLSMGRAGHGMIRLKSAVHSRKKLRGVKLWQRRSDELSKSSRKKTNPKSTP